MFINRIYNRCNVSRSVTLLKCYSTQNIVRSTVPAIDIPKIFLDEYIWRNLDKWKYKTAMQCSETGRTYLYLDLYNKTRSLSNFLRSKKSKINERDTIAIILPNVPEYPIIFLGVIQAGCKVTTVNSFYKSDEIYKQLVDSDAKFIFTTTQLWQEVNQAVQKLNRNIPIVIVKSTKNQNLPTGTIDFHEITDMHFQPEGQINRSVEDTVVLPYSSGTTGLPKGVELTHQNIVANLTQTSVPEFKVTNDAEGSSQEVIPAILPMYHIYGMVTQLLNGLSHGSKFITFSKFVPKDFVKGFEIHRPTITYLVPPLITFLINNDLVTSSTLRPIRTIVSGGAPLGVDVINRLREKCGGKSKFLQSYGLTEASPATHFQSKVLENGINLGGNGLTLPNTECMIVRMNDQQVDENGNIGELLIRGPQVMKRYYKNPEATSNAFWGDGWLKTGDLGFFSENGHLHLTARIKELIKVKGFQVAPFELEEILRTHPNIEDAAVVGVSDPKHGEVPKAFIISRKNKRIDVAEIEKYVAERVAEFKQLKGGIVIVDSIPKSQSGKTLRRVLKTM